MQHVWDVHRMICLGCGMTQIEFVGGCCDGKLQYREYLIGGSIWKKRADRPLTREQIAWIIREKKQGFAIPEDLALEMADAILTKWRDNQRKSA